jgi:hypothetical protein
MNSFSKNSLVVFLTAFIGVCGCHSVPRKSITTGIAPAKVTPLIQTITNSENTAWKIPPRPIEETKPLTNLEEVIKLFRSTYALERARVQHSERTVILFRLSGATLFRNGEIVETARVIPSEYHNLRYAAHVPFMVFLMLNPLCGLPFGETERAKLHNCMEVLTRGEKALDQTKLSAPQLARQHRLFANAIVFLDQVLQEGQVEQNRLKTYARAASIDIEQNMREAGTAQVNGIYEQMLKWRKQIPAEEWTNMCFIVRGPQQPRSGSAITLFLSALLNEPGDGRGYLGESQRLVYREDTSLLPNSVPSFPWEADLQLLAAINLDTAASEALFSDPDRLAVDIVSDGARARIHQLDFSPLLPIEH